MRNVPPSGNDRKRTTDVRSKSFETGNKIPMNEDGPVSLRPEFVYRKMLGEPTGNANLCERPKSLRTIKTVHRNPPPPVSELEPGDRRPRRRTDHPVHRTTRKPESVKVALDLLDDVHS